MNDNRNAARSQRRMSNSCVGVDNFSVGGNEFALCVKALTSLPPFLHMAQPPNADESGNN